MEAENIWQRRREWKLKNRGKLKEIADSLALGYSFVSEVFNGSRHSERVAALLREAKAPGFEDGE